MIRSIVGLTLLIIVLVSQAGCMLLFPLVTAGLGAAHYAGVARKPDAQLITCKCTKEEALEYAVTASRSIGIEPDNMTDGGFTSFKLGVPGITGTELTVTVRTTPKKATEVSVTLKKGFGEAKDRDKFLQTFLEAAGKRAIVIVPDPPAEKKEKSA